MPSAFHPTIKNHQSATTCSPAVPWPASSWLIPASSALWLPRQDPLAPPRSCSTPPAPAPSAPQPASRSEEHTSELQSRLHLVCRLLLEKKKKNIHIE